MEGNNMIIEFLFVFSIFKRTKPIPSLIPSIIYSMGRDKYRANNLKYWALSLFEEVLFLFKIRMHTILLVHTLY
jgi:hypothetical protein